MGDEAAVFVKQTVKRKLFRECREEINGRRILTPSLQID